MMAMASWSRPAGPLRCSSMEMDSSLRPWNEAKARRVSAAVSNGEERAASGSLLNSLISIGRLSMTTPVDFSVRRTLVLYSVSLAGSWTSVLSGCSTGASVFAEDLEEGFEDVFEADFDAVLLDVEALVVPFTAFEAFFTVLETCLPALSTLLMVRVTLLTVFTALVTSSRNPQERILLIC